MVKLLLLFLEDVVHVVSCLGPLLKKGTMVRDIETRRDASSFPFFLNRERQRGGPFGSWWPLCPPIKRKKGKRKSSSQTDTTEIELWWLVIHLCCRARQAGRRLHLVAAHQEQDGHQVVTLLPQERHSGAAIHSLKKGIIWESPAPESFPLLEEDK